MMLMYADAFQVLFLFFKFATSSNILKYLLFAGMQAVLVLSVDNTHMSEDVMVEPGIVMIFAHGIE